MCHFTVTAQHSLRIIIAHPGQDVKLSCALTPSEDQTIAWIMAYTVQELHIDIPTEYSSNGNNLIIEDIKTNDSRNGTRYLCITVGQATKAVQSNSDQSVLYVAGE